MSKIDKLIELNSENNILDNEPLLSTGEKQRILKMTMNKIDTNKTTKGSKKKILIGVLVATMMIGSIALANDHFNLSTDNPLGQYLGIDKNNKSLDGAGIYLNKSVTDNNLKLNVAHTLGDKHSLYILIDVEVPEDIIILENAQFNQMDISLKNPSSAGWGISDLEDEDPNDNKQSYIISYSTEGKLSGNDITLDFEDFGYYSDEDDKFITLVEGNWKTSWKLDYTDVSKEIPVNRLVLNKDNKYFIKNINISPISVSASFIGKNNGLFMINEITFKDGSTYTDKDFASMSSSSSFLNVFTSAEFGKVIDVNQVKSITINGEIINFPN